MLAAALVICLSRLRIECNRFIKVGDCLGVLTRAFKDCPTNLVSSRILGIALYGLRSQFEGFVGVAPFMGRPGALQEFRYVCALEATEKDCGQRAKKQPCARSEEHTSELQSRGHLVCRLLLEKKK